MIQSPQHSARMFGRISFPNMDCCPGLGKVKYIGSIHFVEVFKTVEKDIFLVFTFLPFVLSLCLFW